MYNIIQGVRNLVLGLPSYQKKTEILTGGWSPGKTFIKLNN